MLQLFGQVRFPRCFSADDPGGGWGLFINAKNGKTTRGVTRRLYRGIKGSVSFPCGLSVHGGALTLKGWLLLGVALVESGYDVGCDVE